MNGLIYVPQVNSDGLGRGTGDTGNGGEMTAQATARFGQSLENFGDQLARASQQVQKITGETDAMQRKTGIVTGVDALGEKYRRDPDPSTVVERYDADLQKLREQTLNGVVDPANRAWLDQAFQTARVSGLGTIRSESLKKQDEQYTAGLDAQYNSVAARYAGAKTETERLTVLAEWEGTLKTGTAAGRIGPKAAEAYRQGVVKAGDEAQIWQMIGQNPAAAQAALNDPARFANVDPAMRGQLQRQAQAAAEENEIRRREQRARMDPTLAPILGGRVTSPDQADIVFNRILRGAGERESFAMRHLMARGLTQAQAAGVVGNLIQESGLRTDSVNPGDGRDGSNSIGIGQWNSGRAIALQAFAASKGKPVSDYATQLDFILHELDTSEAAAGRKLRSARTAEEAAAAFIGYERPKDYTDANPTAGHGWSNRRGHALRLGGASLDAERPDGNTAFRDHLKTFDGQIAPAIAAYIGVPTDAAKQAHEAARAKFGDGYNPSQYLQSLPDTVDAATRKKVLAAYQRGSVDINAPALSPAASYRASQALSAVSEQERARLGRIEGEIINNAGKMGGELGAIFKDGNMPDPATYAATVSTLRLGAERGNTAAAQHLRDLEDAVAVQPVVRQMYQMRPEMLEGEVARLQQDVNRGGASMETHRALRLAKGASDKVAQLRKDDPVSLVERQGYFPATPVNVSADLGDPDQLAAFRQQVFQRSLSSDKAFAMYGGQQQFFRPEERYAIKQRWDEMTDGARLKLVQTIAENSHSEAAARAAIMEVSGGKGPAALAGKYALRDPDLARDIMTGAGYMEQEGVKAKIEALKPVLKEVIGGDMLPPMEQAQALEAATAVYAAMRGKNGALYDPDNKEEARTALERVIGKLVKINGRNVPVPKGVSPWEVSNAMRVFNEDMLTELGGAKSPTSTPFTAQFLSRHAQFRAMPEGRALVVLQQAGGERQVLRNDGTPLVVDLKALVTSARKMTPPTAAARTNATLANAYQEGLNREISRQEGNQ